MKITRRTFTTIAAGAGSLGPAVLSAPARAAQFEFKCSSSIGADHPAMAGTKQMWAAVERETGGRLSVTNFPNGILGSDASTLGQLRLGAIQFYIGMANIPSIVPSVGITQVGFSFKDEPEALRAMDGPMGDYLNKEMQAKGLYILPFVWGNGMRDITSSPHPIHVPEDLAGFKIRIAESPIMSDFFKLLGANPVSVAYNETYTSLQTHIIDGEESPLGAIEAARLFEVQKYLSLTHHVWTGAAIVTNLQVWNGLPEDIRNVVLRNLKKYGTVERRQVALYVAAVADKFARRGLAVNKVDPSTFRARLGPYYTNWSKQFGTTAWTLLQNSVSGKLT